MGQFCSQPEEEPDKKQKPTPIGGVIKKEDPVEEDPVISPKIVEKPTPDPTPAPIVPEW